MENKRPAVSVIVPAYNMELYIRRCLESVLSQTMTDFEAIVINDCSTDGTMAVVREIASRDSRVVVIDKPRNEGTMMARKTGYETARADRLFFIDGDDWLPSDSLQRLSDEMDRTGAEIVLGSSIEIGEGREDRYLPRTHIEIPDISTMYRALISNKMPAYMWGGLYERRLFEGELENFMNQCINEDYMLLLQILQRTHHVVFIEDVVYYYYFNRRSITRARAPLSRMEHDLFANKWCYDFLSSRGIWPTQATKHYIRRVVKNLEAGFTWRQICQTGLVDSKIFNTYNFLKYTSPRYLLKYWGLVLLRGMKPRSMQRT